MLSYQDVQGFYRFISSVREIDEFLFEVRIISFLLFDKNNEVKLRERMIKKFAEADKLDYYGTKEEVKDNEDYFPYVYVPFYLELPNK